MELLQDVKDITTFNQTKQYQILRTNIPQFMTYLSLFWGTNRFNEFVQQILDEAPAGFSLDVIAALLEVMKVHCATIAPVKQVVEFKKDYQWDNNGKRR